MASNQDLVDPQLAAAASAAMNVDAPAVADASMVDPLQDAPWKKGEFDRPEKIEGSNFHWTKDMGIPPELAYFGLTEQSIDFPGFLRLRSDQGFKKRYMDAFCRFAHHSDLMKWLAEPKEGWVPIEELLNLIKFAYEQTDNLFGKEDSLLRAQFLMIWIWTYRLQFRNRSMDSGASEHGDVRIEQGYLLQLEKSLWMQHAKPVLRSIGHRFKMAVKAIANANLKEGDVEEAWQIFRSKTGLQDLPDLNFQDLSDVLQQRTRWGWDQWVIAYAFCINAKYDQLLGCEHFEPQANDFPGIDYDWSSLKPTEQDMSKFLGFRLPGPKKGQSWASYASDLAAWKDANEPSMEAEIKAQKDAWPVQGQDKKSDKDPHPDDQASKKHKKEPQNPDMWQTWPNVKSTAQTPVTYSGGWSQDWGGKSHQSTPGWNYASEPNQWGKGKDSHASSSRSAAFQNKDSSTSDDRGGRVQGF